MKLLHLKNNHVFFAGILFTLPALYFIFLFVIGYYFQLPYLFDVSNPFQEKSGIIGSIGFNVNLIIVFGPVLAFLINTLAILHLQIQSNNDTISLQVELRKSWLNIMLMLCSGIVLLILFTYW